MTTQTNGSVAGHVGGMLAELREARNLTPADLARRAGLDTRAIQQAELNAGAYFPPETISGIMKVLDEVEQLTLQERAAILGPSEAARAENRRAAIAEATPAAERGLEHQPAPDAPDTADACTRPQATPLTKSYTSCGLLLRALRLERRLPVLELAVLTCLPEEVIEAAEIAGPIAPHLTERILHALDEAFPLSADQREFFRDEVEMSRPWKGKRKGDREAGVPLQDRSGDHTHPGTSTGDPRVAA